MNLKSILSMIAPTIATVLGGPLAGGAVKLLADKILGNADASEDEVFNAISVASPELLSKIKQWDYDYKNAMIKAGVDLEKIASSDRDSARKRQMITKDMTPTILAYVTTIGFFLTLTLMIFSRQISTNPVLDIMLGTLGSAWVGVITYYFGSSKGSSDKNHLINYGKRS